jgi:hypothetical protein
MKMTRAAVIAALAFMSAGAVASLLTVAGPGDADPVRRPAPPVVAQQLPAQDCRASGITPPCWTRYNAGDEVVWNGRGQVAFAGGTVHVGRAA